MKAQIKKSIFTLGMVSTFALMSCNQKETVVKEPMKVKVAATDMSSSDELTQAAEQLISPYTFMLAYKMAATAYEKDPTNKKAEFYYLFLKRFEAFRGILTRVYPGLDEQGKKEVDAYLQEQLPNSPLKDFLTEKGGSAITKPSDVQDVLVKYFAASNEFRKFLKDNEQTEMNINLNPYVFEGAIKSELMNSCGIYEGADGTFTYECDATQISIKKMNSADLIALRQTAAGEVLYGMFYTAYSINGLEKLKDSDPSMTNQQKTDMLLALPEFGKLRNDNSLKLMRELGSDLSAATSWALKYQETLCKKRQGYLYDQGICISHPTEAQDLVNQLNAALGGAIELALPTANNRENKLKTKVDIFAWSKNPMTDLRQVAPLGWNECGRATAIKDNTAGGIFVENNADVFVLKTNCQK
ncbi:hypothetical protein [Pseudobdellovibrio sp. HCB154]|uniref:hypothetical protein n=1 Tax=Pseudobdellovibrio sp. HCB154 TaxID=3386277 RepID=UPI00391723DA